jgi:antitoxin component HigA of HigAB toxin-antitoxin module
MRTAAKTTRQTRLPTKFAKLNAAHPLRPIADEVDFRNAQEIADRLAVLDRRTRDQDDYLETLTLLMAKYEDDHDPIRTGDLEPAAIVRQLMSGHDMTASDLGRLLGNRTLGPAILRGERELSHANIVSHANHIRVIAILLLKYNHA